MERIYEAFIGILRGHLTGQAPQYPRDTDWQEVASLARMHSLQAIVYHELRKLPDIPETVLENLAECYHKTLFRDTQFDYVRQSIAQKLTHTKVEHVFLRGICLKHDYPVPALRSMSDIDILAHAEDLETIHRAMEELGGRLAEKDDNHRSYLFSASVLVEVHPNLLRRTSVGAAINPGWQYARRDTGAYELEMTEEGFYLNTVCHLAHHFSGGGTGVRSIVDIWVCRNLRSPQPDRAFVERELERCGLLTFVRNIEALAQAWFGDGELTPQLEELGDYILTSGTYGTAGRYLLSAAYLAEGKWSSLNKKLFPPRQALEDEYPWCKGRGALLPAAWAARLWNRATHENGTLLKRWGKDNLAMSARDVHAHGEKIRRFGIHKDSSKKRDI